MDRATRFDLRPDSLTLWELVEERAERTPAAVLAVDEVGRSLSFGDYRHRCLRAAGALAERGVVEGTAVAWMLPTRLEALVLAGALGRLGAFQVPLVPIIGERELRFILDQSGAELLVTSGPWRGQDYPALARSALSSVDRDIALIIADPDLPEADPDVTLPSLAPASGGEGPIRWVFYTSGTTADPKGTLHTDATVAACAHRLNLRFRMSEEDCYSLVFPVTHIGGISCLMSGLMAGFRHVLIETFKADTSCAALAREGVTVAGAGPAFWTTYVNEQRRHPDVRLFTKLRALVGGGAPKPVTMHEDVTEVLGVPLATGYGLSECPALAHSGVDDPDEVLRSDGYALDDTEIKIVGPNGEPLAPGHSGEIVVRGPMLFKGYLDARLNADAFDPDGFHRTGDLGQLDAGGLLTVTGRTKDIIIRKGENISAKEIEDILQRMPSVAEVAVVGVPDADRGERCCAVIVLESDAAALTLDDISAECRKAGLSRHKTPEQLEIVAALPRNPTGKVIKTALRDRLAAAEAVS